MGLHAEHSVQITKQVQKHTSVLIFGKDGPMPGTTIHHMVPRTRKFDAQRTSHSETITHINKRQRFDPFLLSSAASPYKCLRIRICWEPFFEQGWVPFGER